MKKIIILFIFLFITYSFYISPIAYANDFDGEKGRCGAQCDCPGGDFCHVGCWSGYSCVDVGTGDGKKYCWNSSCGADTPSVTPTTPLPPGSILGRIANWDSSIVYKCPSCTYGGQFQCDTKPILDKTITISSPLGLVGNYKTSYCNASGPYYSSGPLTTGSYTVSVNALGNETVKWTCHGSDPLGNPVSATLCPAPTGAGNSVTVQVSSQVLTHVWFYFASPTPTPAQFAIDFLGIKLGKMVGTTIPRFGGFPLRVCPLDSKKYNFWGPFSCIFFWTGF